MKPALSVVLPLRNEAGNVAVLVAEIVAALTPAFTFEIIAVNDGSTDATLKVLQSLDVPALKIISHQYSAGQSAAIDSGIRRAAQYPFVATLDGDGQNDPADLPKLWAWLSQQSLPAMAIGRREKRQDSGWRLFCSRIAGACRRGILGDSVPDSGCGIKILNTDLYLSLPYFDHLHRFMPTLVKRAGGLVESIPVNHRTRGTGISNYVTWHRALHGIVDLLGVRWLLWRNRKRIYI